MRRRGTLFLSVQWISGHLQCSMGNGRTVKGQSDLDLTVSHNAIALHHATI
jgi:hypothetical protein